MSEEHGPTPGDVHTALVSSRVGRWVVSALVALGTVWIVAPNLPAGPARDVVDVAWSPAVEVGIEQNWAVFSPNPRDQSVGIEALLDYDDGTTLVWRPPDLDPIVGAVREYRWRKWEEQVRLDGNERAWDATARWLAENNSVDGRLPAAVRLVRTWRVHEPLTADGAVDGGPNRYEFHRWERDDG